MDRKAIVKMLKNAGYPLLYEIRDNAGFNDFEKQLFVHRYIKDNFVENVFRYKIFCGKTKYHETHNIILLKISYYLKMAKNYLEDKDYWCDPSERAYKNAEKRIKHNENK